MALTETFCLTSHDNVLVKRFVCLGVRADENYRRLTVGDGDAMRYLYLCWMTTEQIKQVLNTGKRDASTVVDIGTAIVQMV